MKVLYVLDYGTVGGATIAAVDMVLGVRKLGVIPIVVTGGPHSSFNDYLTSLEIENVPAGHYTALESFVFKSWKSPLGYIKRFVRYWIFEIIAIKKLEKYVDFSNIDIIHTNSARNSIGGTLSNKYHIPHIVHIREFADKDFSCIKLRSNYIKFLNQSSCCFLSVSKAVLRYWNSKGIDSKKNRLLYDGVNYHDIIQSKIDYHNKYLKMVIVGGVVPTKGQHLIVEAIGKLPKDVIENISLDIIGWGSKLYMQKMKDYASNHGYSDRINFIGSVNDVHKRLHKYNVGLMCSKSEGFGLVTAEYMHAGLGIIASNSGSCPELIHNYESGIIFNSGDSSDLARCILEFYNNRELLYKCAHNAREYAIEHFTTEINSKAIVEIYKKYKNH